MTHLKLNIAAVLADCVARAIHTAEDLCDAGVEQVLDRLDYVHIELQTLAACEPLASAHRVGEVLHRAVCDVYAGETPLSQFGGFVADVGLSGYVTPVEYADRCAAAFDARYFTPVGV